MPDAIIIILLLVGCDSFVWNGGIVASKKLLALVCRQTGGEVICYSFRKW